MPAGEKTKELWDDPEYRKMMSEAHKGNKKAKGAYSFPKGKNNPDYDPEVVEKIRQSKLGDKNPMYGKRPHNYIDGQYVTERNAPEAREWRRQVFIRDDYTCQECGERGCTLNAHHIKHWAKHKKLRFNLNNGITLCYMCHRKKHFKIEGSGDSV